MFTKAIQTVYLAIGCFTVCAAVGAQTTPKSHDIIERENVQRAQPALRSIFVLELSLLRYRASMETESELTLEQGEALNLFLQRYSSSLTNTVDAKLDAESSPTLLDASAQRLRRAFQRHDSAYSAAILDISERMIASLSLLRNTKEGKPHLSEREQSYASRHALTIW